MHADPYRYFRVEARELLESLSGTIEELTRGSASAGLMPRLFRLAHTLKGAARVVRQVELAGLAHEREEVLAPARDAGRSLDPEEAKKLMALLDAMETHVDGLDQAPAPAGATPAPRLGAEDALRTVRIEVGDIDAVLRAVTETGVQLSVLKANVLGLRQLTGLSAALASHLRASSNVPTPEVKGPGLAEDLREGLARVVQGLVAGVERIDQELAEVRDGTDRLRLVPAESIFPSLARAAKDAASALGKQAEVEVRGGDLRVDAQVLAPLRDALLHLVRNAVAHGIEGPAERAAAGKTKSGRIELRVARRDHQLVFSCRDDGHGIDVPAVRRELVARGRVSELEAKTLADSLLIERLLSGGLSTTASVTQISGRGVGLDVVREVAERLEGDVAIESEPGRGTYVEIRVPVSLSALHAVLVDAGTTSVSIPLEAVEETLRVSSTDLGRSGTGDSLAHGGKVIPFVPLSRLLRKADLGARTVWPTLIVRANGRSAAIGVDRLRGTCDVVVRPLPAAARADPVVAGASLDAEGNPQLVLDAKGLVDAAAESPGTRAETVVVLPPVLVIDDSLTTRMLEQSILESAGYTVELAVSAEQGLEKARQKHYGLFIVDVEMQGMDGFDFVGRTRADPELSRVPAILVTSRGTAEDQLRGERSGASAYIVKSDFDQTVLLETIRRLLG
jgi:two-component system chemotaxis sensor kinase CheA